MLLQANPNFSHLTLVWEAACLPSPRGNICFPTDNQFCTVGSETNLLVLEHKTKGDHFK
jgi:hypothetical protein